MLHFFWLIILLVIITPVLRSGVMGAVLGLIGLVVMLIMLLSSGNAVPFIIILALCVGFILYATRNRKEYELQKQKEEAISRQAANTNTDYAQNSNTKSKYAPSSDIMSCSIEERMHHLGVSNLQELFNKYPQYITIDELNTLISAGLIRTYDDTVSKDGVYVDNENSEEWEDFEYEYDKDHKVNHP